MPWVGSLSNPLDVVRMMAGSIRRFWRVLDRVDAVWLVGSYLVSFVFAAMAARGASASCSACVRTCPSTRAARHPGRRWIHLAADALEGGLPAARPGASRSRSSAPASPGTSGSARSLLELSVSLVSEDDIVSRDEAPAPLLRR